MEAVACTPRRVASPTPSLQPRAMSVGCKLPWRCSSGGHANGTLRSGYSSPRRAARGNCLEPAPPPARQRWRVGALAGSSSLSISSVDEAAWEKAYGRSALPLGISLEQGARETMEDAVQVVPHGRHGFLFATVFDGHGGFAAAEYMQQHLYDVYTRVLDAQGYGQDQPDGSNERLPFTRILIEAFKAADAQLLAWMQEHVDEDERTSGCTATTCLVHPDLLVVANVGDSRAVLCRAGHAVDLSTEHRVWGKTPEVQAEVERVEAVGGWVDDGRVCGVLAVSRAFGDMEFKGEEGLRMLLQKGIDFELWDKEFANSRHFTGDPVTSQPDITEQPLQDDDEFVIVASDGLWDVMDSQEVVRLARRDLHRRQTPQEVASRLTSLAVKRGSQDNVAVVLVDLGKTEWGKDRGGGGFLSNLFGGR